MVVVRGKHLVVTPQFPFNLMFLPEIHGLDLEVPTDAVSAITPVTTFFRKALRIEFEYGGVAPIEIVVHDENAFVNAVGRQTIKHGGRDLKAPAGTRKSRSLIGMRVFFAIWGAGAVFAAVTGLQQDWHYRQVGLVAVATYVNPDDRIDGQGKMGVLTYQVGGISHRLTSISGVGLFKVGEQEQIYYLPSDPRDARESGYFHFDLLWLGLGLAALTISLFGGAFARRIW
ncbi:hypothetical protein [Novosphingobium sp. SG720]|uniref:hypothetical protein n=1 Tax=Novosphingobium sp. SG720 TaxID=2586998 RepID=UPI0014489A48|nr:hypothetical protein [Novosphingobium sp. SG720]NKJ44757.1 hypothetical protein [Novosphingobium sp. SG720]